MEAIEALPPPNKRDIATPLPVTRTTAAGDEASVASRRPTWRAAVLRDHRVPRGTALRRARPQHALVICHPHVGQRQCAVDLARCTWAVSRARRSRAASDSCGRKCGAIHEAMVRFAEGDRSAIDVLVAELWPVLLDFARRGLQSDHDAEDVAQEVFVRICSRIVEFDRARDGLSWAFGIAGYEVLTLRRKRQRRRETSDMPLRSAVDMQSLADDVLVHEELLAAFRGCGCMAPMARPERRR